MGDCRAHLLGHLCDRNGPQDCCVSNRVLQRWMGHVRFGRAVLSAGKALLRCQAWAHLCLTTHLTQTQPASQLLILMSAVDLWILVPFVSQSSASPGVALLIASLRVLRIARLIRVVAFIKPLYDVFQSLTVQYRRVSAMFVAACLLHRPTAWCTGVAATRGVGHVAACHVAVRVCGDGDAPCGAQPCVGWAPPGERCFRVVWHR